MSRPVLLPLRGVRPSAVSRWNGLWLGLMAMPAWAELPAGVALQAPVAVYRFLADNLVLPESHDEAERVRRARAAEEQSRKLLETEGYFSASVTARARPDGGLLIAVDPGRRAVVSQVDIRFSGHVAEDIPMPARRRARLQRAWSLPAGRPFRQADWDKAKQQLLDALVARDYPAASLAASRAEVDPEQGTVRLEVTLDSGPPFVLGPLEISGLETYDAGLIHRYNRLKPGERYSQARLLELQQSLQNTPYFAAVLVDVDTQLEPNGDNYTPRRVPVHVRLTEAKPKRLSLSLGVSSNNGARLGADFSNANLFGRGWQWVSGLRLDRIEQLAFADLHLPPNPDGYRSSFGLLAERNVNQGLDLSQIGLGADRRRVQGRIETKLSVNALEEWRRVESGEATRNRALPFNWTWTWRNVDNPLDPRQGQVLSVQLGGGSRTLLSDQNFLRTLVRGQQFWSLGERHVFSLRGELGWVAAPSRRGIPETLLFRAGGAQSVRGYAYQSLGVPEGGAVVGGRYLTTLSAEYIHWFGPQWGGAVFLDAGNASDDAKQLRPLQRGYGIGVRWRSPAGPLAFDLAYGARDHKVRPVFSIEIAF